MMFIRPLKSPKVFGIGFHKTGTTMLAKSLKILGYRVNGPNGVDDPNIEQRALQMADRLLEKYDAFQDDPWPLLYRHVDARFPGSKFVLTIRRSDKWIESMVRHFGSQPTPMRRWIYGIGYPFGSERAYVERYEKHNREVVAYFQDRPNDLLVLDVAAADSWALQLRCHLQQLRSVLQNPPYPNLNNRKELPQ